MQNMFIKCFAFIRLNRSAILHLIDCIRVQYYRFRCDAINLMQRMWERGKLPVIVGGTSYYVESVLYDDNLIATNTTQSCIICNFYCILFIFAIIATLGKVFSV